MNKKNISIIVVQKHKNNKHARHGGSWKIAYADFMTAMMAFFLVMWLLSTSTPLQLQQIAEYFQMPLRVALSGGNKSSLSDGIIPGGGDDPVKQDGEEFKQQPQKIEQQKNSNRLKSALQKIQALIKNDPRLSNFQSNIRLSLVDKGLLIQIIDSQDRPMFKVGSKILEPYMKNILRALAPVLNELPNRISLTGHTDSLPYTGGDEGYSNWELSSDRANASRSVLVSSGMASNKILRIIGTADTMRLANSKIDDPINRRISILVLSKDQENEILKEDTLLQSMDSQLDTRKVSAKLEVTPVINNHTSNGPGLTNNAKEIVK